MTLLPRFINKMRGEQIPTLLEPGTESPHSTMAWKPKLFPKLTSSFLGYSSAPLPFLLPSHPPYLPFMDWEKKRNVCGLPTGPSTSLRRGAQGVGNAARIRPRPSMCRSLGYSSIMAPRVCIELSPESGLCCLGCRDWVYTANETGQTVRMSPHGDAHLGNLTIALPLSR